MLININTQTKYAPICLQINDSIVTENKVITNEFNNFFRSIATKIDSKIIRTKTNFPNSIPAQILKQFKRTLSELLNNH